jgi:DNA-binding ferritin-like protein
MSTQETVLRKVGSVEESEALRLDREKAEQLVDALNTDLAATYVLYHQVKKHHWNVEGAEFRELHEFLGDVAYDLEVAADEFAERARTIAARRSRAAPPMRSTRPSNPRATTSTTSGRRCATTWRRWGR